MPPGGWLNGQAPKRSWRWRKEHLGGAPAFTPPPPPRRRGRPRKRDIEAANAPSWREWRWLLTFPPRGTHLFVTAYRARLIYLWQAYGPRVIEHYQRRHGCSPPGQAEWERRCGAVR
jgi:hypothetical protein